MIFYFPPTGYDLMKLMTVVLIKKKKTNKQQYKTTWQSMWQEELKKTKNKIKKPKQLQGK